MKSTVCSLFAALFIVTLIASCDSSTGTDGTPEGQRVGSFMVYSDQNEADWVGTPGAMQHKASIATIASDTTVYNSPEGKSLQLLYNPRFEDQITVHYEDSSITETTLDTTDIGYSVDINTPFGPASSSNGYQPILQVSFDIPFACDSSYTDEEYFYISYLDDTYEHPEPVDSTVVEQTVQLDIEGIYQAGNDLVCK